MTEEQCFSNQLNTLADCFSECNLYGKAIIVSVKILSLILILFVVIGIAMPKHMITYHLIFCLILLFCFTIDYFPLNNLLTSALNTQLNNDTNSKYNKNQIINASKQTPFSTETCKILLLIIIMITILNFIYPEYSFNAMCIKTYNFINKVDPSAEKELDSNQIIATEFKIKSNVNANVNANANANINQQINNLNGGYNTNQLLDGFNDPNSLKAIYDKSDSN